MSADRTSAQKWPLLRLDEVAGVSSGVTLGRTVPESSALKLPYLRVANVQDGYIDTADLKYLHILPHELDRFRLLPGDLLLTEGGDFDKLGRGAVWDGRVDPCLHQNHVFRVRCRPEVMLPEFLSLYVSSTAGRRYFLSVAKQTTNLATISSTQLKAMPVPCPPISDQRRIVDAVFAVTEAEMAAAVEIDKADTIREAVVEQLLRPLVGDIRVADVGQVRMGKQLSPASREFGAQFPYLRVANVHDGWIRYSDVNFMGFSSAEREAYSLASGDILLNEGQSLELVGRSAIYEGASGAYYFQNTLIRFRPGSNLLSDYAQLVFRWWRRTGVFAGIAKQTTSIAHLGAERFGALCFPLIPMGDQRRISETVGLISELQASSGADVAKLAQIRRSLVAKLLTGAPGD